MRKKLTDLCTIQYGYAFDSESFTTDNSFPPLVRIRDVKRGFSETFYSGDYPPEYVIHSGDLLIGMDGEFNIARWRSGDALLNQRVCKISATRGTDEEYLRFALQKALKEIEDRTAFVTVKHLSAKELNKLELDIPDMGEQARIAQILCKLERVISMREAELSALDDLIKARFVEMFGDCKNEVQIGDVVSICRGASPRPIQAFITNDPEGVNWIKIGDVAENSLYITKTAEKITKEGANKSRVVHKGDFILSNSMSFGRPYIMGIDGCVHDGWLILSEFRESFDELFLYHAIRSEKVQHQFSGAVNGATVKNLNSDLVKTTNIVLPEMGDQKVFSEYRLKIFDAYRPQRAVTHFMNWALDTDDVRMKEYFYPELDKDVLFPLGYIMERSGHSRGSTVDLTLFDMTTEKEVDMGGTFDYFGELSHPDYADITQEQYANRMILREAMLAHGFKPLAEEWWHFTLENEPYPNTYFTFPINSESLPVEQAA